VTFDLAANRSKVHRRSAEPWKVTVVDTGEKTQTGGRLKRVREYVGDQPFCLTYGDGVGNVDITESIAFFRAQKKALAVVTAVQPHGRFGALTLEGTQVTRFFEKPRGDHDWVNGGFFVLSPKVFGYIDGDDTAWEQAPMKRLAREGRLAAYQHSGFWQPMDTVRERNLLEGLWATGKAPWQIWK
jgi:glucose-1-phosphate cytidylyltransferase